MKKHQNIQLFVLLVYSLLTFTTSLKAQSGSESTARGININFSCTPDETIKGKILLQWSAGCEEGLNHFVLERSSDGTNFNDIAIIFPAGEPAGFGQYKFRDAKLTTPSGKYFYRLRLINTAGGYTYSEIWSTPATGK